MKLGVIGVGEIAGAVVEALCTSDVTDLAVNLSPRNEQNSSALSQRFDRVRRLETNQQVLDESDVVIISVRPEAAKSVLGELTFRSDHQVISLVTFLALSELAEAVAPARAICRAIPLPAVVTHHCPIPICPSNETAERLFGYIGRPLPVEDEVRFHVLWSLTGFIAPFYELLGELGDWATGHGVDQATANRYVAELYEALSRLAQKTDAIDFGELVRRATTPNGMNEQAGGEIRRQGAHRIYRTAADNLLKRLT